MQYLWIGVGNSDEGRAEIIKNGGKLLSAEVSNDALLAGLEASGVLCDTINSSHLPTYPEYPQKIVPSNTWIYKNGMQGISVGYLNFPYINLLSKKSAMKKQAKEWGHCHGKDDVTVFVYQMHTPFLSAANAIKKIIPNARVVLIVPDLPQYMDMHMSILKKILKRIDWVIMQQYLKRVSHYVLYSKHMADFLKLQPDSWIVMEGSYDPSLLIDGGETYQNTEKIAVMYSGVLDMRYGIPQLLDAMELLDDRYELWLTGDGNAVPLIQERAKSDSRIRYFGFLPSREALLKKQREATMLISTRDPNEPASKYCFPSKLFEYMVSGKPVLSTRIQGIPEEYFGFLISLPGVEPQTLCSSIMRVAQMSETERELFGSKARDFILMNKNNVAQAEKILKFTAREI